MTNPVRFPGYAQLRLLWRPMALVSLFPLMLGVLYPLAVLPNGPSDLLAALRAGTAGLDVQYALWRECIALPAAIAIGLAIASREGMQSGMGWMLPGYRLQMRASTGLIALLSALSVAVATARVLPFFYGFTAFGLGILAFSLAWRAFDPSASKSLRWTARVLVAVFVLRPEYLAGAARSAPLLVGLVAVVLGAALFSTGMSTAAARTLASQSTGGLDSLREGNEKTPWEWWGRRWTPPSLPGLIQAGIYESAGVGKLSRFHRGILVLVYFSVTGWLTWSSSMVAVMPMIFMGFIGGQMKETFPYPISRRRRADAFFLASLVDAVTLGALVAITVVLLVQLGWWREKEAGRNTPGYALMTLLFLVVLAPVAQIVLARGPLTLKRGRKPRSWQLIASFAAMLLWLAAATYAGKKFGLLYGSHAAASVVALLSGFIAIQAAFWISLRFWFARRDLS